LTKNEVRGALFKSLSAGEDRDYLTGKPISGRWKGKHSIDRPAKEFKGERPVIGGPQHRVMQFSPD
jgi:hypothetical protein